MDLHLPAPPSLPHLPHLIDVTTSIPKPPPPFPWPPFDFDSVHAVKTFDC